MKIAQCYYAYCRVLNTKVLDGQENLFMAVLDGVKGNTDIELRLWTLDDAKYRGDVVFAVEGKQTAEVLMDFLKILSDIQSVCLKDYGILLRGVLRYGDISYYDGQLNEIELQKVQMYLSQTRSFPRILFDDLIYEDLRRCFDGPISENVHESPFAAKDRYDGGYFINYIYQLLDFIFADCPPDSGKEVVVDDFMGGIEEKGHLVAENVVLEEAYYWVWQKIILGLNYMDKGLADGSEDDI